MAAEALEITLCHMARKDGPAYPTLDELIRQLQFAREIYGSDAVISLTSGPSLFDRVYYVIDSNSAREEK